VRRTAALLGASLLLALPVEAKIEKAAFGETPEHEKVDLTPPKPCGRSRASWSQYTAHGAFCFETEHHPDSQNHPNFPSTELKPGETFHETTVFRFPKPL